MSSTKNENSTADTLKILASVVILIVALFAYYQIQQLGYPVVLSFLALFALLAAAGYVFYSSGPGNTLFRFFSASQQELRRVIWPTRQETLQLTLIVVFVVILFGLFLWLVDKFLAFVRFGIIGG